LHATETENNSPHHASIPELQLAKEVSEKQSLERKMSNLSIEPPEQNFNEDRVIREAIWGAEVNSERGLQASGGN
jgi:hypothetical protein